MLAQDLPATALQATRACAARIAIIYPTQSVMLFGSRARGTAHAESDAGVAVVIKGEPGHFVRTKMAMNTAYEILLDTGIRIQPLPVWVSEWAHPQNYSNPHLLHNIARGGITLS